MTGTTESGLSSEADTKKVSYFRFWILATLLLLLDQVSKWVIAELSGFRMGLYPPFDGVEVIPGFFNIVYAINHGAAWGMLEGYGWLLILLAFVVLGLIAFFRKDLGFEQQANQWCFGMITAGIVGNTIDRVLRGHVVDFLDIRLPGYQWPTFNVADSAIVVGTIWYVYLQFRPAKK